MSQNKTRALAHMVFFTLNKSTPASRAALVAGCRKYLSRHPGTLHFSAGTRATACDRDVNDTAFDVALHIVFRSQAAHDRYQAAPRHLAFIEAFRANWKQVRVFDSLLG